MLFISRKNSEQPVKQTAVGARLELLENIRGVVMEERVHVSRGLVCMYVCYYPSY